MIVQDSYDYIQIGLCVRLLRNISAENTPSLAAGAIKNLCDCLKQGNFEVSLASMSSEAFGKMEDELESADIKKEIPVPLVTNISRQFGILENVIFAEAVTKKIYVLPSRRFNSEFLLNAPNKLLRDGAYEKLEDIARADFSSSCRCMLFGEATAAAFHILRATESVLKSYYHHHRRQKRLARPMWGPMLDQLRAKSKSKPPASLLMSLDLIRTAYRNPTQHPEAIYEIDSAQDLFGVCLDVIGKMTDELSKA